jgi:hypothetical protein
MPELYFALTQYSLFFIATCEASSRREIVCLIKLPVHEENRELNNDCSTL